MQGHAAHLDKPFDRHFPHVLWFRGNFSSSKPIFDRDTAQSQATHVQQYLSVCLCVSRIIACFGIKFNDAFCWFVNTHTNDPFDACQMKFHWILCTDFLFYGIRLTDTNCFRNDSLLLSAEWIAHGVLSTPFPCLFVWFCLSLCAELKWAHIQRNPIETTMRVMRELLPNKANNLYFVHE